MSDEQDQAPGADPEVPGMIDKLIQPPADKKKRTRRSFGPYKFNAEAGQEIIKIITRGNFLETAADFVGIRRNTVRLWLKRGKAKETPALAKFYKNYRRAIAAAEILHVNNIFESSVGAKNAGVSMSWIARRYRSRYAEGQKIEHTGKNGAPLGPAVIIELPDNGSVPPRPPAAPGKKKAA